MISSKKNKILIISYLNSHFMALLPLIKYLQKNKKYDPVCLFTDNFITNIDNAISICRNNKIEVIDMVGNRMIKSNKYNHSQPVDFIHSISNILINLPIIDSILLTYINYRTIKQKLKNAENLFNKIKPKLVIVCEENSIYMTSIFTKIALKYSTPSLIIPYTLANEKEMAESLYKTNEICDIPSKLIGILFPRWVYRYKKKRLLLVSYSQIIGMELQKISVEYPWSINSGFCDAIAVESSYMEKYYLKNNLSKEKLIITGSISDDVLYSKNNKFNSESIKLRQKYGFESKPIILCAIPPSQPNRNTQFDDYNKILEFWIKTLSKVKNYDIVFNLHPNIAGKNKDLIKKYGINIVDNNISDLLPLCDIYIASVSATIRWAIACGKPVINYDVYKYRYHDYDSAKGVVTVEKKEDFEKVLKKITTNKKYYKELKEKQEKCAPDWGMLDGKSGKRIIDLIERLVKDGK